MSKPTDDTNVTTTSVDVMSPYYIHASDNPGQLYVSEILHDGNYGDWANEMSNALFAKNKIGFVGGSIPMPEDKSEKLMLWKRCNAMVKGWLNTAMEKEIRNSVKYAATAEEVWRDLKERFGKESAPRAFELKRAISLTRQDKSSVSAYYTKLRGLWDEVNSVSPIPICTCGKCTCDLSKKYVVAREKEQLYEFLMGLDETFETVKSHILSTKPTPTIGTAYHLISEDERHRQISTVQRTPVETAAFQAQQKQVDTGNRSIMFQKHHSERDGGDRREGRRERPHCAHCQKPGHLIDTCYELIGYPPDWRKGSRDNNKRNGHQKERRPPPRAAQVETESSPIPGLTNEQYGKFLEFFHSENERSMPPVDAPIANMAGKLPFTRPWVIDSGATEHITCDDKILSNQTTTGVGLPVKIPNGDNIPVKSVGKTCLPNGLNIDRVLNIPEFKCNLL